MFHFFGRMRGNGRKAAPDYRLLDYADHLRFIRPFVQARYGSEPAQEILSILKDSADDEWTYSRSRKALQPLTGRGDAEFLARVELMASEAIGGVNSAIGAANECGTRMERRLQVFAPDGMKPCASCRMLSGKAWTVDCRSRRSGKSLSPTTGPRPGTEPNKRISAYVYAYPLILVIGSATPS